MNLRSVALPMLLLVTSVVALSLSALADEQEPNDLIGDATPITAGAHAGALAVGQDESDYFKFEVTAGQRIDVALTSATAGDFLYLTLYDSAESKAFEVKSKGSVPASDAFWTANETGTSTWYLHAWSDTEGGSYTLTLGLADPNDAGTQRDAGATTGGALPISAGGELGGHLEDLDGIDLFSFTAGSGDIITVEFTSQSVDDHLHLAILDHEESSVLDLGSKAGDKVAGAWYTANETPSLDWYVGVELDVGPGDYTFKVVITHQDDGGSGDDAGGDYPTAHYVFPATLSGHLQQADTKDLFAFMAGSGDAISVDFTSQSPDGDMALYLVDSTYDTLVTLRAKQGVTVSDAYWTANETAMALYYIRVELDASPGDYQVVLGVVAQDDAGLLDDAPEALADSLAILPGLHSGHLEDEDDFDAFRFEAGEGDAILVEFSSNSGLDLIVLELVDRDEVTVLALESQGGVEETGTYCTANETAMAWFFLRVVMDTSPGDYTFELVVARQDDAGSGMDAAGAILYGLPLQNGPVQGQLGGLDTHDYYSFEVMGGWVVNVNLTNEQSVSMTCGIIGDTTSQLPIGTVASASGEVGRGTWTVPLSVVKGSHWYLRVVAATGFVPGSYALELQVKETPPDQETPMISFADPTGATEGRPLALTAIVTDDIAVLDVRLFFKIDDEVTWSELQMNRTTGDNYTATVPGAEMAGQSFKFYIIARDTSFNDRSHGSQNSPRLVGIAPADAVPPDLYYKPPSSVVKGKDFTISVEATDNVGVVSVMAYFKIDDEPTWHELALTQSGAVYKGTIPSSDLQGSKLHYYIVAEDAAGGTDTYGTGTDPKTLSIKPKDEEPGFTAAAATAAVAAIASALAATVRGGRRR